MRKVLAIAFFFLLFCATCFAQTEFHGLTPGKSTRVDVERVLGQPVNKVSATLIEYRPQPLTSNIYVQYRTGSTVVERIEVSCRLENSTCDDFGKSANLRLPKNPETAKVPQNTSEKHALYYGPPLYVVTTYGDDGVGQSKAVPARIGFYSRELYASAVGAVKEKNAEINRIIGDSLNAGNAALNSRNYDEAIKQYDLGLATDPTQIALLTSKAAAFKARGIQKYNAAIVTRDAVGIDAAKTDFKNAADTANKAAQLLKEQSAATNEDKRAAFAVRADVFRLFVSKADTTQADAGISAFQDYLAVETDPAKKLRAQLDLAQMLLDTGAVDKAFAEFRKILVTQPDNPDANLGAGLALFSTGDKGKYQDAANYLQRFIENAPDTHKNKDDAKAILDELRSSEKIVPRRP
jgi:tetratricopeptide (TPR) repeat protein